MSQYLNDELKSDRNLGELDISTGYFNVSGYKLLCESLWQFSNLPNFKLRLLFGKDAISREENSKNFEKHIEYLSSELNSTKNSEMNNDVDVSFEDEISELNFEEGPVKIVDDLIRFLNLGKVLVRSNKNRFNHSKCYIFDDSAAVGSSNLTGAGLAGNVELNAVLRQVAAQKELKEWYEKRWNEAQDSKDELIRTIEQSKFGYPLEPYGMYMKILYEYYRQTLEDIETAKGTRIELPEFQKDAVVSSLRIMDKYGGVIISDSTGLGKTHIGLSILRELASVRRQKVLLIAPRQVIDAVWEPRLTEESIKTTNVTLESTGTESFDPTDYLKYPVVLIDESHNYRTASTNRYNNIMKVLAGGNRKTVILLTATPVNNSLIDLYNQLNLITSGEDSHFAKIGIPDLRSYFLRADKKQLATGIEDIVKILDEVMIRRTRNYIREHYPEATLNDVKIKFPDRLLRKVEYSLTNVFGTSLYKKIIETIDNLNLVPYRTATYRYIIDEKEKEEVEHRASLQKYGLLKRFESSVEAVRKSITRLLLFYDTFEKTLDHGKIINSSIFQEALSEYLIKDDEVDDDEFQDLVTKLSEKELESTKEFDEKRMRKELRYDIGLLKPLKQSLDGIQPWTDSKLNELKTVLIKDKVFESGGKKVVIFSQFVDTAKYVYEDLKNNLKDKKISLLTGKTKPEARKKTLMEFSPGANNPEQKSIEQETDILVTSDVLSEGQNLQDCNYAINYDLPWNPMKIVQRVGRIDRLTSRHQTVTSAVFFPEKELEDELGLLVKLARKIQKAAVTVGVESTILGEKASPRTFNAFERIKKEDASLLDDMERSAELLPSMTPFQQILNHLKKIGQEELIGIAYGRRSGKESDDSGLVLCYKEKGRKDSLHLLYYDYKNKMFSHINDVTWIFRAIRCIEETPLSVPLEGLEVFRHIHMIDTKARSEVLTAINTPFELKKTQEIKPKYQKELYNIIFNGYHSGKVSLDEVSSVYTTIGKGNYFAWEREFKELYDKFQRDQDIHSLIASLSKLINEYKIKSRIISEVRELGPEDLTLVGCMFLVNSSFKDWNILAA
jgi:ERCC4-related helicase